MATDDRVRAGVKHGRHLPYAGPHHRPQPPPLPAAGTQSDHSPGKDHTWDRDWTSLDDWKRWLTVAGADHSSFTDAPILEVAFQNP